MSAATELPSISTPALTADAALDGSTLVLALRGNADMDARPRLGAYLVEVHRQARRLGVERVVVDLHRLEFMTSSCFKDFVSWLGEIMDLPPEEQYRIHFRFSDAVLWQRRSLHALRCFAMDLVTVEPG